MTQPSNEARILLALQALQNNRKLSLRRAAKNYEVKYRYSTLLLNVGGFTLNFRIKVQD
jgi:hypothetical protein